MFMILKGKPSARRRNPGQAATEYMIVVALTLLILSPIISKGMSQIGQMKQEESLLSARHALNTIGDAARLVYSLGPPSRYEVSVGFPSNTVGAGIRNKLVYLNLSTGDGYTQLFEDFDFNVTGSISPAPGGHTLVIEAVLNESCGGCDVYVNITEVSQ